jgi:hypothetical protein
MELVDIQDYASGIATRLDAAAIDVRKPKLLKPQLDNRLVDQDE